MQLEPLTWQGKGFSFSPPPDVPLDAENSEAQERLPLADFSIFVQASKGAYGMGLNIHGDHRDTQGDLCGGSVEKSLPAKAEDMGSIPDPGSSHMPWSNYTWVPELLNQHSRAQESQLLSP